MAFNTVRGASLRLSLAAAALLCASGVARAQHVVTADEAAKLTLEALTAPPPPSRPMYRAYFHRAMASRFVERREHRSAREPVFARASFHHELRRAAHRGRMRA